MSEVNANVLKNFMIRTLGIEKLNRYQAQSYNIDRYNFDIADTDDSEDIDLDEILENSELYEQFATMYKEERDKETAEPDQEREDKVAGTQGEGGATQ